MDADGPSRPFYLGVRLDDDPHAACLLLDARDPGHLVETPDIDHLEDLPADALVMIDGRDAEPRGGAQERLLVSRGLVWSLLDPAAAGRRARLLVSDRLTAEQVLRSEGLDLWEGLCRWRELPPDLLDRVRHLLAPFSARVATTLDVLTAMSRSCESNPFTGWAAETPFVPQGVAAAAPAPLPDDPDEIAAWMTAADGLGAIHGEDFQPREQQADMARDVAGTLASGTPLMLEAGTGIGKTHAYLAPLLAHLRRTGHRGLVSTHTRALQHQILDHDLPGLSAVATDIVTRPLMGRGNYLCRSRLLMFRERTPASLGEAWASASLQLWLAVTRDGLREEVEDHPALRPYLGELFDSPEPCAPSVCYGREECFVQRARRLAREAQLVVVNHSLLMHDFAADHTLVGEYQTLVVDEAHRLPQVALDCFEVRCDAARALIVEDMLGSRGRDVSRPQLLRTLRRGFEHRREEAADAVAALETFAAAVAAALTAYRRWLDALSRRYTEWLEAHARPQGRLRVQDRDEVFGRVTPETSALLTASGEAGTAYAAFARCLEGAEGPEPDTEDDLATLARVAELLTNLERDVFFLVDREDPDWVVWLEPGSGEALAAVGATKLEPGPLLADLWRGAGLSPVLTSATLCVGEDFDFMARELGVRGLQPGLITSLIDSPFAYEAQSLFLTTPDFPAPDSRNYLAAVSRLLKELLSAVPRKTLVLFTSYAALQTVAAELREEGEDGYEFKLDLDRHWQSRRPAILTQGSGLSPAELMARFRRENRAVLLGTNTFWEGVDLPGTELEILVVTKLPFLVPADPWVAARCDLIQAEGENPFIRFMVRDSVLRLRQGIGRLIRSDVDRGVVFLLDSRLHNKAYGKTFLDAMPTSVRYCAGPEEMVARADAFFASA